MSSLQTLYEMMLRLADSRSRHMLDGQRIGMVYEGKVISVERATQRT